MPGEGQSAWSAEAWVEAAEVGPGLSSTVLRKHVCEIHAEKNTSSSTDIRMHVDGKLKKYFTFSE